MEAIRQLEEAQREQLFVTGLIYYEEPRPTIGETLNLAPTPLSQMQGDQLRPSASALEDLMKQYM